MRTEIVQSSLRNSPIFVRQSKENLLSPQAFFEKGFIICNMHIHDETEGITVLNGTMRLIAAGEEYLVHSGESVFIGGRVPHQTEIAENGTFAHEFIQFMPDMLNNNYLSGSVNYLYRFLNLTDVYVFKNGLPITDEVSACLRAIHREYESKKPAYETYILGNLQLFLGCMYRNGILNNPDNVFDKHEIEKILPILKFVNENYAESISLDYASDMLNLNRDYFCRLFKKITTMTFTDYLNFVRVCHSEKLLTFSDKSISEISLDTGFASVSYFNRVFKKLKSVTPSEYRRSKYMKKR